MLPVLLLRTLLRGIIMSDAIDEDELHTGRRREGSYMGVNAFIEHLTLALVGGSTTLILKLSGYDEALRTQPASVSAGIRLGMSLLPVVALALFFLAIRRYPLGRERVAS